MVTGLVLLGKSTGNPWVFTIKFDGLSGSNFPIIQFYEMGKWADGGAMIDFKRKRLVANLRLGVVAQTCPDTSGSSTCIGISYIYMYIIYRIILTYSPWNMYNGENMRKLFQTLTTIPFCAASSKGIPLKDLHNGPPQCLELTFSVKVSMLIVSNPCFVHLPVPETTMVDIEPLPGTWFPYRRYHFHCSTLALGGVVAVVEGERKVIRSYSLLVLAACQEASSDSPTPKDK